MSINDAGRLANEGSLLELADGRKLALNFGYGGLRLIEDNYGSVGNLLKALAPPPKPKNAPKDAEEPTPLDGRVFTAVLDGLTYGLWRTRITLEDLEANLNPADIETHIGVLSEALVAAFPRQAQAAKPAAEVTSTSTGPAPTTQPLLSSVEPTKPSGN